MTSEDSISLEPIEVLAALRDGASLTGRPPVDEDSYLAAFGAFMAMYQDATEVEDVRRRALTRAKEFSNDNQQTTGEMK